MNKKCKVTLGGYTYFANFYGVYQVSQIIPPSLLLGGHNGGVVSQPVAVIDYGDGLKEVELDAVFDVEEK